MIAQRTETHLVATLMHEIGRSRFDLGPFAGAAAKPALQAGMP